jgi:DNA polymerase III epsilon subunit-like protein
MNKQQSAGLTKPETCTEQTYIVLDTETSGLPLFPHGPPGLFYHPGYMYAYNRARVIEVAWQVIVSATTIASHHTTLVLPEQRSSFSIHPDAQRIHGISPKMLMAEEVASTTSMLLHLCSVISKRPTVMVGHNVAFDWHVLMSEAIRVDCRRAIRVLSMTPIRCTMYETTIFCGLKRSGNLPKWPTLLQLAQRLFGSDFAPGKQHRALADVLLTSKCFVELQKRASEGTTAAATVCRH